MASIRKEIGLNQTAERVWEALRDFQTVDRRVAPGFVTRSEPDGTARIVTFANGTTATEELVDCDDTSRRLVYMISNERLKHYSAAVQVFADGEACCVDGGPATRVGKLCPSADGRSGQGHETHARGCRTMKALGPPFPGSQRRCARAVPTQAVIALDAIAGANPGQSP